MKIAIALASSSSHISGVHRHAINLARCLLTRREVTAVHLVAAPWQMDFLHDSAPHSDPRVHIQAAAIGAGTFSRNLWYYRQLPKLAQELDTDLVHLAYPAPLRAGAFHCPTVVTLHDLYPYDVPGNFGFPKVLVNRLILRQCLSAANAIACVSSSTLSRLRQLQPAIAREKAVVISNCVETQTRTAGISPLPQLRGQPFLLCVAQHRSNKNLLFLLQTFVRLLRASTMPARTRLVIVGAEGPETMSIVRFLYRAGIADRVVLLSGITEAELQWCYRNSRMLLAPSLIEGFGLPVAEALLAGCHVICSDISAFREIGGHHCQYVPLDAAAETAFAEAILATVRRASPDPVAMPQLSSPLIGEQYLRLYAAQLSRAKAPARRIPDSTRNSEQDFIL